MTVSTANLGCAKMTIEKIDSHEPPVKRPNRIGEWLKREAKDLFPDLRLAQKLIRTSAAELGTQIDSDPAYEAAEEFNKSLAPTEGAKYEWVWDYAKFQFERADRLHRDLDDKANDIIKYLGGGTGLFTLAALANMTPQNVWVIFASLPAFALALISIALAARARYPNPTKEPPAIKSAYMYAEHLEDKTAKIRFIGQWHLTVEGMHLAIKAKAVRVKLATKCYVWAIVSLAIPIITAMLLTANTALTR